MQLAISLSNNDYRNNKHGRSISFRTNIHKNTTANHTILTNAWLFNFNIVFLYFNTVFPSFYKSAEARRIEVFVAVTCNRNFRRCCWTSSSFSNLMHLIDSFSSPNKGKSLGPKSKRLYGGCCNYSQSIPSLFSIRWMLCDDTFSCWRMTDFCTIPGRFMRSAGRTRSDNKVQ